VVSLHTFVFCRLNILFYNFILRNFLLLGGIEEAKEKEPSKPKSNDRTKYEKQCYAKDADEEENIIFEDFAKLRMSMSEIDNWTLNNCLLILRDFRLLRSILSLLLLLLFASFQKVLMSSSLYSWIHLQTLHQCDVILCTTSTFLANTVVHKEWIYIALNNALYSLRTMYSFVAGFDEININFCEKEIRFGET